MCQKTEKSAKDEGDRILSGFSSWKVLLPVLIGLGVTAYMFCQEYEPGAFSTFSFGLEAAVFFFVAILCMMGRDFGYMVRIRTLSDGDLSWKASFRVIMLWEFASCVTPSAVGGTSVALFFIKSEGISAGRSAGMVMVTSFLDELYFALVFPIVILLIGYSDIFLENVSPTLAQGFAVAAWTGYAIKTAYVLLLAYGLFVNPEGLKWLLVSLFKLPFLKRWRGKVERVGNDIVETAHHFRHWSSRGWAKAFLATVLSWTSRYWVVNALIVAFFGLSHLGLFEHFVLFGKQLSMWIMMLVSPTPGGSGVAEWIFKEFLSCYIPVGAMALALCWRLVSYYPYLLMGAVLLPRWVREITSRRQKQIQVNAD